MLEYNPIKPSGKESWIDDSFSPKNTTLLLPFEILSDNLTCGEMDFNLIANGYEEVNGKVAYISTDLGKMTCFIYPIGGLVSINTISGNVQDKLYDHL